MWVRNPHRSGRLVGPDRLELSTLRLSGVRSNHLSYGPMKAPLKDGRAPVLEPDGLAITSPAWKRPPLGPPAGDEVERETKTATSRTCILSMTNQ